MQTLRRFPRPIALALAALLGSACAALAPLREPPSSASADNLASVSTRDEAIARFGPPAEVRASDLGDVLVYRRRAVVDETPNRFYGIDHGNSLVQYERLLLYVDQDGRIVRRAVEIE